MFSAHVKGIAIDQIKTPRGMSHPFFVYVPCKGPFGGYFAKWIVFAKL